ncbi:Spy/CpxP family protein refolding chaperone [Serratia quinivorans]|uniref:Spy/CpxP family protein refolding chaperone n=1 Tax=Serratia quinivorans TaxID=137545 RepID=UPI001C48A62D|nr:Spy/CpxP family protein refolding chaperone [Serratia quinivorans]MBV6695011.1 Spy/CpxP family protein refolding chaperone [Serratia quinivorans]CAI1209240.1 P pilus assembly/Cpx signaling pathway, periplasmic inhibitor/zinc-resistance associated protein [Serratia quinivorans]CAI2023631.1 P pilus assembly/Cpx signaling pathway, periplasmic inhibitor/zinc-resistance associated protein [Serratia quinivorans]
MKKRIKMLIAGMCLFSAGSVFAAEGLQSASRLAGVLDLSQTQRQEIHVIRDKAQLQLDSIKTDKVDNGAILKVLGSSQWDEPTVKKRIAEMGIYQQQADYIRYRYLFDVMQTLTPEQKTKLQKMIK